MDVGFGDRIKARRLELKLSQTALAKRVKVTQGAIAQIELGISQSSAKIVALAQALNVSPEWLLYGKNPPADPKLALYTLDEKNFITSENCDIGLKKSFLKEHKWDSEYIEFMKAPDESMAPTISIFDDVAVNRLETTIHENGVFAIRRGSGITLLRRIILGASQHWIYRCDNLDKTRFSDVSANQSDVIVGRVIWRGGSNSFNF